MKSILHDADLRRLQSELREIHEALRANRVETALLRRKSDALRQRRESLRQDLAAKHVGLSGEGCSGEVPLDASSSG